MRNRGQANGITLKVYAGATGVLLAMDIDERLREDFLGFAIKRTHQTKQGASVSRWIQGLLRFPKQKGKKLTPIGTNKAPLQKFRWSDYLVTPGKDYIYKLYALHGDYKSPTMTEGPDVAITTESLTGTIHQVVFNRAAAASQAYQKKFAGINPEDTDLHPTFRKLAQLWLARNMDVTIKDFIQKAVDKNWALDVAIYEIELSWVAKELKKALERGVTLRILYHDKKDDEQTHENEKCIKSLPAEVKRGRVTNEIFHQKFIVLSNRESEDHAWNPTSVLTGTANFTFNGVYRQANVVHIVEDPPLAQQYHALFNKLWDDCRSNLSLTRSYIESENIIPAKGNDPATQVIFSPRENFGDTKKVVEILKDAKSDVLFCTAFALHPDVLQALKPEEDDEIIRYGLQNTESKITGIHRRGEFVAAAYLKKGFESMVKESLAGQKGNLFIHLKTIVRDFTTNEPWVIVGSNNFSNASSHDNDENMLVIRGNTAVADTYICEMMRLYDHYRFRWNQKRKWLVKKQGQTKLRKDSKWTKPYFDPENLEYHERVRFSAP
ncbi:MAG: phospholipase D-like domain-containing protein [Candidatus Thorarchaeota archaeon]